MQILRRSNSAYQDVSHACNLSHSKLSANINEIRYWPVLSVTIRGWGRVEEGSRDARQRVRQSRRIENRERERDGQTERKSRGKGTKERETCKDRRERKRWTLHPVGVRALRSYKCGFVSSFTGQSNGLR